MSTEPSAPEGLNTTESTDMNLNPLIFSWSGEGSFATSVGNTFTRQAGVEEAMKQGVKVKGNMGENAFATSDFCDSDTRKAQMMIINILFTRKKSFIFRGAATLRHFFMQN